MLKSLKNKKTILLGTLTTFTLFSALLTAQAREKMKGEVDTDTAYVQSMDDSYSTFKAKIKIKSSGTYYIIAGFYKGECWHKGSFLGTKYFNHKVISGDAGDSIDVSIDDIPEPPLNKNITVGVFHSLDGICTNG